MTEKKLMMMSQELKKKGGVQDSQLLKDALAQMAKNDGKDLSRSMQYQNLK